MSGVVSGIVSGVGAAVLGAAAARPGLTGGIVVFSVVFGMISANALWYQPPGGHPAPLLRTRDEDDRRLLFGFQRPGEPEAVTTFRIERPDPGGTASIGSAPAGVADAAGNAASELVRGVQAELARLGHYRGEADGLAGPRTAAAILAFQKAAGLPETGEPSDGLLATLKAKTAGQAPAPARPGAAPVAVPAARPTAIPARAEAADPVAEAIRNAERAATPVKADSGLVTQIQRGLSKFAYSHIVVDGVAGASTREAIRNFERAYRLPETGEPNERVLKKLKEIGAL